jgi:hypothetical protein
MLAQQALPAAVAGKDKAIGVPVLAAGTSDNGPGPLVSHFGRP